MKPTPELLEQVVSSLKKQGARYADVRLTTTSRELVKVRDGVVDAINASTEPALGVRVLLRNGWGFAGTTTVDEPSLHAAARLAMEVAAASDLATTDQIQLSDIEPVRAEWHSRFEVDPWSVPIQKKIAHLLEALERARGKSEIHQVSGEISSYRQEKLFVSSEGSRILQSSTEMGAGIEAIAMRGDEFQRRNYPNPVGGDFAARGWEFIEELDLKTNAVRIASEAVSLLDAPKAPAGTFDLIIGSSQLALQIHESCGHPTELDRALGWEISLAGGSFLQTGMLGSFRYGSPLVTIVADATVPQSIGSFGYDDDGVPAQRFPLVEKGMFVNYLTGRDTAPLIGKASNGTVRGESANRIPIIRMTNINLDPGETPLEEMIAATKRGVFVDTNKSWSIDDLRLNFQFSCEVAWEIVDGKLGRMLKNPIYTGQTPEFWRSCDMVGDRSTWQIWGLPNCGKGDPMQTMRVAHAAPAARFRNVEMA
jgi:TldD protein